MNEQAVEELHQLLHMLVVNQCLLLMSDQDSSRWAAARATLLKQMDQFEATLEAS